MGYKETKEKFDILGVELGIKIQERMIELLDEVRFDKESDDEESADDDDDFDDFDDDDDDDFGDGDAHPAHSELFLLMELYRTVHKT